MVFESRLIPILLNTFFNCATNPFERSRSSGVFAKSHDEVQVGQSRPTQLEVTNVES